MQNTIEILSAIVCLLEKRSEILKSNHDQFESMVDDPLLQFLFPILWHCSNGLVELPEHKRNQISAVYWQNQARYTVLRKRMGDVLQAFDTEKIDVIVLKGIILSETLYPSPGLRPMNDIDLLVQDIDFPRAVKLLERIGWQPYELEGASLWQIADNGSLEPDWVMGELPLRDQDGNNLDLHWHLIPFPWWRKAYGINLNLVWKSAVPLTYIGFESALGLSPIHTLAYMCLHQALHGLQSLRNLLDVDQFIKKFTFSIEWSWDQFITCASEWKIRSSAYHIFCFCKYLFHTPISDDILNRLDPGHIAKGRVIALINPHDYLDYSSASWGIRYPGLIKAMIVDKTSDLILLLARVLIPEKAYLRHRYKNDFSLFNHWKHIFQVIARGD